VKKVHVQCTWHVKEKNNNIHQDPGGELEEQELVEPVNNNKQCYCTHNVHKWFAVKDVTFLINDLSILVSTCICSVYNMSSCVVSELQSQAEGK